jgi:hypothetical protein
MTKKATAIFRLPDYLVDDEQYISVTRVYNTSEAKFIKEIQEDLTDEYAADRTKDMEFVALITNAGSETEIILEQDL